MKSIFKQKVYKSHYRFTVVAGRNANPYIDDVEYQLSKIGIEYVGEKEVMTIDIEMPLLQIGEKFYIEELEKTVTIRDRIRSSKENIVYYIDQEVLEADKPQEEVISKIIEAKKLKVEIASLKKTNRQINETVKDLEEQIERYKKEEESKKRLSMFERILRP